MLLYPLLLLSLLLNAIITTKRGFSGGSVVKNPPVNEGDMVQSLGQEDPLERGMATHSSILAWETPWTEKAGGLQSRGSQKSRT